MVNAPAPKLLRIPHSFHSVDEVLGAAKQLNLTNIIVLSERENGSLVTLTSDRTIAEANWMLDTFKAFLLGLLR